MGLQVITAGAAPVSLDEAKLHLRVDTDLEDSKIQSLIDSATERAIAYTQRQLCTASLRYTLDGFPDGRTIKLPMPPLVSVTSVEYYDEDGNLLTLDEEMYHVDTSETYGRIVLVDGECWPATECGRPASVRIDYVAGYGAPADVPARIREAILLEVGDGYAFRETNVVGTVTSRMQRTVEFLLAPYRVF